MKKRLNIDIEISDIFQLRIIEALAKKSLVYDGKIPIRTQKKGNNNNHNETTLSEQIILRDHYSSAFKNIYNESFVLEINQALNLKKFKAGISTLLVEFPILNSNYHQKDGVFFRTLNSNSILEYDYEDLSNDTQASESFSKKINLLVKNKFSIEKDKLIRFYLFKFSDTGYKLLTLFFHGIMDGTSIVNVLLPRLLEIINSENKEDLKTKKSNEIKDFYAFKDKIEESYSVNLEKKLTYWSNFFEQTEPFHINNLSGDPNNHSGSQETFIFDHKIKNNLISCANKLGISLFDILLGTFFLLLNKFTGQNNLSIKTNVDERLYAPQFANTLGCFINNAFIGTTIDESSSLKNLLTQTKNNKEESIKHLISYHLMLEKFRDKTTTLSAVHFNVEPEELKSSRHQQSQLYTHSGEVKNNLYFELDIKNDHILGRVEYKTALFSQAFIQELIRCYEHILHNLSSFIEQPIRKISLLSQEEHKKVIYTFNQTERDFPHKKTIHELFEEQVARTPNHTAVIYEEQRITYQQLNTRANQLAHYLVNQHKVQADDLIPIVMGRSEYLLATILSVLKAGAA